MSRVRADRRTAPLELLMDQCRAVEIRVHINEFIRGRKIHFRGQRCTGVLIFLMRNHARYSQVRNQYTGSRVT